MFQQNVLHDIVVTVSVSPEVRHLHVTPIQTGSRHTCGIFAACQTMNGCIRPVLIQPLPLVNVYIRRIYAWDESKSTYRTFPFVQTQIAVSTGYIIANQLFGRVSARPLLLVSTVAHNTPAMLIKLHQHRQVCKSRFSDSYHISKYKKWMATNSHPFYCLTSLSRRMFKCLHQYSSSLKKKSSLLG